MVFGSCSSTSNSTPVNVASISDRTAPLPASDTSVSPNNSEISSSDEMEPQSCGEKLKSEQEVDELLSNAIVNMSKEEIAAEKKRLGKFYIYRYSRRIVTGMPSELVNEIFFGYENDYEKKQTMEGNTLTEIWSLTERGFLGVKRYFRVLVFKDNRLVKIICQD